MYQLCSLSGLTSAEWAAWAQAIGTILAVIGAAFAAIWQSRKQHESALRLLKEEHRFERIELTKSLLELAKNCEKVLAVFIRTFNDDRAVVGEIAEGRVHLDFDELVRAEQAVSGILAVKASHLHDDC